ncbi:hypothetical protein BGZ72_008355 [Mortierella alpina]|nr:hypothetical protein BGZ72_008355 [Mortierella alpina]
MNVYHLKLDLYSENTSHTAPSSSPTPPRQAETPTAATLASRFRALLKPFPQPHHQALDIPSSSSFSLESSQSPATTSAKADTIRTHRAIHQTDHTNQTRPSTDYRLGPIHISSLDAPSSISSFQIPKDKPGTQKHKSNKAKKMAINTAAPTGRSPGFQDAEPAQGILRLYKDTNEITTGDLHIQSATEDAKELTTVASTEATSHSLDRDGSQTIHPDQGTAVCVLAVPSYMSPGDFLNFVGPVRANVSHFRIIRDAVPNRFMVLMKFRTSEATAEFYARYNGRTFSSLEPEICHVVYLKTIEIRAGCMPPYAFPFLNEDPFLQNKSPTATTAPTSISATLGSTATSPDSDTTATDTVSTQLQQSITASTDTTGLAELPTCPVCLERMDSSVTGLLTILCQHTFHCHCLSKWGEGSCPVCRYSQKSIKKSSTTASANAREGGLTATTDGITEDQNECALCGTTENLWICLICGHIGCGRYQEKHAYHHYYETSHLYALELETQRVWDYAGDGYVHRLIQNKADGKLVELPSAVDGTVPSQHAVQVGQEKLDAIGLEYTYLLTSQLESQRLYFDAQMAAMAAQLAQVNKEAKEWEKEATELNERNRELALMAESLEKERVPMLIKEKKAAEKRLEKLQERLQLMERQYEEEKEMNVGLRSNQDSFKEKLQLKEAEIMDLQEQVRDMMIYLDTQQRVEASPIKDELVNGTVGVMMAPGGSVPAVSSSSSNQSRRKGGRK